MIEFFSKKGTIPIYTFVKGKNMKYENIKCPGCGRLFQDGDDVVVCPECGTPQHRQCYESNGGCVNGRLHETGFVWENPILPAEEKDNKSEEKRNDDEKLVCPRCGKEAEKGTTVCPNCGMKFTMFGFNIVEKQQQLAKEEEEDRKRRLETGYGDYSDADEIPPISKVVDERVKLLAPGISEQQKQEVLCGHTIDKVISFVGYGAKSYVNKFRKLRDGKSFTFNWAAFLLSPFWFFFRKLYKPGIVLLTVNIILSLVSTVPMNRLSAVVGDYTLSEFLALPADQQQFMTTQMMKLLPAIMLLNFISLAIAVVCGIIADKLYYRYTESSLNEIDAVSDNTFKLSLLAKYGSTSRWAPFFAFAAVWMLPGLILMLFGS